MELAGRALDWISDHLPEFDPYPVDGKMDVLRAKAAAERLDEFAPFRFIEPLSLEIHYKRIEAAQTASRGLKAGERVDPYTVRWRLDSLADYF